MKSCLHIYTKKFYFFLIQTVSQLKQNRSKNCITTRKKQQADNGMPSQLTAYKAELPQIKPQDKTHIVGKAVEMRRSRYYNMLFLLGISMPHTHTHTAVGRQKPAVTGHVSRAINRCLPALQHRFTHIQP